MLVLDECMQIFALTSIPINLVEDYITKMYNSYENRLHSHLYPEALMILEWGDGLRPLKREVHHKLRKEGFKNF